jgi:biotin carboxylase
MPKKQLMIIGAGKFQLPGIKKALELGLEVIATDGNPDAPGLKVATRSEVLDVKDIKGHLKLAKSLKLNGVLSISAEPPLRTVAAVAKEKKLTTTSLKAIEIGLNKGLQRRLFLKNKLSQPRFALAKNYKEALKAVSAIGFPSVIKPVDNAGSRGVYVLENKSELRLATKQAFSFSKTKEIIIEEFIEGTECTVDGITIGGKHHILAISDKYKPESKFRVATQLCYPARFPQAVITEIEKMMKKAYSAMGIDNAPTHSEVIVSKNKPVIVEVACRGGGFYIFTHAVEATSGIDVLSLWIKTCLGESVKVGKPLKRGVVLKWLAPSPGKLRAINGVDRLKKIKGLIDYGFFIKPGGEIPELTTDGKRTGYILIKGRDSQEALERIDLASKSLVFDIERD